MKRSSSENEPVIAYSVKLWYGQWKMVKAVKRQYCQIRFLIFLSKGILYPQIAAGLSTQTVAFTQY